MQTKSNRSYLDKYIRKTDMCWWWTGCRNDKGYGRVKYHGRMWTAHRLIYSLDIRPIPPGLLACHHCDNPSCVNPDHIFIGTALDNHKDRDAKGRGAYGERSRQSDLKESDILAIRKRYIPYVVSLACLAQEYNVSKKNILNIVKQRVWKHLL